MLARFIWAEFVFNSYSTQHMIGTIMLGISVGCPGFDFGFFDKVAKIR